MLPALDHAPAFMLRQSLELREQRATQGRRMVGEQMHEHRTAGSDFPRLISADAFIALQAKQLKPVRQYHPVLL
jgi:hypothetical protein